jgi:hypothetical protein
MDFPALFATAISSIKGTKDVASGLLSMNIDFAVKEKTVDLIEKIQSLHVQLFEIKDRMIELDNDKRDLLEKINNINNWEQKVVPHYVITALSDSVIVYKVRDTEEAQAATGNTPHYLCVGCYETRRKSFLQKKGYDGCGAILECHGCGAVIHNPSDRPPSVGPIAVSVPRSRIDFGGY